MVRFDRGGGEDAEMYFCDQKSLSMPTLRMTSEAKVCALSHIIMCPKTVHGVYTVVASTEHLHNSVTCNLIQCMQINLVEKWMVLKMTTSR